MDFKDVIEKRRTYRSYTKDIVSRDLLKVLVRAANKSPVSCNLQLSKFVIVDDKNILDNLSREVSYKFSYAPCTIVVIYDSRFTIDRNSAVMTTGMAVENMILQATDLGLGTCPMAGFSKDEKIKKILDIPKHFNIALLLSVGYVNNDISLRDIPKIEEEQTFSFNKFSNLKTINQSVDLEDHSITSIIDYRSRIAPVYLDRFRLNTWPDKYYSDVVHFFMYNFLSHDVNSIFDLMTYDGKFLKLLKEKKNNLDITTSDYIQDNIDYFSKYFNCSAKLIDKNNNILNINNNSLDFITFIFQAQFTPEIDSLLLSANSKLKIGGKLFLTSVSEHLFKILIKKIINLYHRTFNSMIYNIYENNIFYKVGPIKHMTDKEIISICEKSGFKLIKKGLVSEYKDKGVKINYYLFEK